MTRHVARVGWSTDAAPGDVRAGRYSRVHALRFDGGAEVMGAPSPDIVPTPWTDPAGVDPEEAFVASVAACHMLWFLDLARRAGHAPQAYEDEAVGTMSRNEAGELWISRIALRPLTAWSGTPPDEAEIAALHEAAHAKCFIANSVRTEIEIEAASARPAHEVTE